MKFIYVSIFVCIVPHIVQAAQASMAEEQQSPLQSFARIVRLQSLSKEQLLQRLQANKKIIAGNLFLVGSIPLYAGTSEDVWGKIRNIKNAQNQSPAIQPNDILIEIAIQDKGLQSLVSDAAKNVNGIWHQDLDSTDRHLCAHSFPKYFPLIWIDKAQTGDIIEMEYKNPETGKKYCMELMCSDRAIFQNFAHHLARLKQRFAEKPNFWFTDKELLIKKDVIKEDGQNSYIHRTNGYTYKHEQ